LLTDELLCKSFASRELDVCGAIATAQAVIKKVGPKS